MMDRASGNAGPGTEDAPEIDRLRREVRALRHEIAGLDPVPARAVPRGAMIATGLGAVAIGGAIVTASLTIDLPATAGWGLVARMVPTQTAVGIVERIFTVY